MLILVEGKAYQFYTTVTHLDNPKLGPWKFGLALSSDLINLIVPPTLLSSMSHRQPTKVVKQLTVAASAAELNTLRVRASHRRGQLST